jgi:putative endonuclease
LVPSPSAVIQTERSESRNLQLSFAPASFDADLRHANPTRDEYPSAVDERLYSIYIVASRRRTLYIGVTGDLRKRVFQYKWKEYEGFSAKYNCDRLAWFENYQDVVEAIARETQLKKWNRAKKIALIERMNPRGQT